MPYPFLVPFRIGGTSFPFLSFFTPFTPPGDLWISTIARLPVPGLEQVALLPASWTQIEEHLGFGPAGLGFGGVLPPLWSLNIGLMDTLMQSGQFLNIYCTRQKLYPLCPSPGYFLNCELVEHSQPQLVCF